MKVFNIFKHNYVITDLPISLRVNIVGVMQNKRDVFFKQIILKSGNFALKIECLLIIKLLVFLQRRNATEKE